MSIFIHVYDLDAPGWLGFSLHAIINNLSQRVNGLSLDAHIGGARPNTWRLVSLRLRSICNRYGIQCPGLAYTAAKMHNLGTGYPTLYTGSAVYAICHYLHYHVHMAVTIAYFESLVPSPG